MFLLTVPLYQSIKFPYNSGCLHSLYHSCHYECDLHLNLKFLYCTNHKYVSNTTFKTGIVMYSTVKRENHKSHNDLLLPMRCSSLFILSLHLKAVPHAPDSLNNLGFGCIRLYLIPYLVDMHCYSCNIPD